MKIVVSPVNFLSFVKGIVLFLLAGQKKNPSLGGRVYQHTGWLHGCDVKMITPITELALER
jgi:hypothetical protein